MNHFPLLEGLRAERERHEAEVTAPVRARLSECQAWNSRLETTIREIERVMGSEIGKHIVEVVASQLAGEVRKAVFEALANAGHKRGGVATVQVPADALSFMNPESLEREVVRRWADETMPKISLRIDRDQSDFTSVLDIRVPQFGFRKHVHT